MPRKVSRSDFVSSGQPNPPSRALLRGIWGPRTTSTRPWCNKAILGTSDHRKAPACCPLSCGLAFNERPPTKSLSRGLSNLRSVRLAGLEPTTSLGASQGALPLPRFHLNVILRRRRSILSLPGFVRVNLCAILFFYDMQSRRPKRAH